MTQIYKFIVVFLTLLILSGCANKNTRVGGMGAGAYSSSGSGYTGILQIGTAF